MSFYANPGAKAFGFLGEVPDKVDAYGGMTMAEGAFLPNGRVLEPMTFAFLLVGAMIPYWFAALTMKSVGKVPDVSMIV